jgi:hypothetical protein
MADIPMNTDKMVQGLGYVSVPMPTTDAASLDGAESSQIPNLPQGQPSPTQAVSIATTKQDANPLGARQTTTLHRDGWLDYTVPHFEQGSIDE